MKKIVLLLLCAFALGIQPAAAQIFRKPSKKVLTLKVDSLSRYADSLAKELAYYQETADTLIDEGIIEGAFEEDLDNEDFYYDSLSTEQRLSIYYHQNALHKMFEEDPVSMDDLDSVQLASDIPDSVYIQRLKQMNSFIQLPYNSIVKNYLIVYTQKMADRIPTILGLAQYYMPIFEEMFDQYDMPLELKAMAVIESALNPRAVSRAKAKGMWQFMYRTALSYKLVINSYVDERFDPVRSCQAAAQYLRDSYAVFGDWALAIASYNCGVGNVNKAIRRAGGSQNFWDIYPYLPRETRGYVPAFVAALYVMHYYPEHQIKPQVVEMPAHVDTFEVRKMLHFEQITAFLDISLDELRDLNPQYIKDIVPGVERPYILRIPFEYSGDFAAHEKEIYAYKDSVYFSPLLMNTAAKATDSQITHRVRNGETLSSIAYRYGVRIADIKYWNNLRSDRININQRLIIYTDRNAAPKKTAAAPATKSSAASASTSTPSGTLVKHTVRSGETLGGIAEKYHVTAANIRSWNNLRGSTIYAGKTLKIYTKVTSVTAAQTTPATTTSGSFEYYTVKKGDTLWDISQQLGISMDNIRQLNGFGRTPKLMVGQKIKVKAL